MSNPPKPKPIVIVGAPRSGTNMLRDVLTGLRGVGTWPCDEINYIWRHGNVGYPSDEFTANMATPSVKRFVQKQFDKLTRHNDFQFVIEKTCANSLRVEFVDEILPDARYIEIVRDGIDVVASARKRWSASLDVPYILKKARYVPITDLPYYATQYFVNRIHRLTSKEKRLATWGPKLDLMDDILLGRTLEEICAIQWRRCIENAERGFSGMGPEKVYRIQYEDFVRQPHDALKKICGYIGLQVPESEIELAVEGVSPKSIGKGYEELGPSLVRQILPFLGGGDHLDQIQMSKI